MKKMLLIILGLFIHMKSYPNEHILIKVNAKCNFEDTFFKNCSQNDFRKLIDTSSQYDENVNFFLTIIVSKKYVEFKVKEKKIKYRLLKVNSDTIIFESLKRNIFKGISACNTQTYPYLILTNLKSKEISMFYDRSSIQRKNFSVFEGEILLYSPN